MKFIDITGQKFGRLTVIKEIKPHICPKGAKVRMVLCQCECGNKTKVYYSNLKSNYTKSCGCLARETVSKRFKGKRLSITHRNKLSDAHKGKYGYWNNKKFSKEHKNKLKSVHKGKKLSIRTRQKMSDAQNIIVKNGQHNFWKGGITNKSKKIRNSSKNRLWREAVFKRDNWTCQKCGLKGVYLHSHHIKLFAEFPKLRFDINNGITLCKNCHYLEHTHNFI